MNPKTKALFKTIAVIILLSSIACQELELAPMPAPRSFLNFVAASGRAATPASHSANWCISKALLKMGPEEQCPGVWFGSGAALYGALSCCAREVDLTASDIEYHKKHLKWYRYVE